MGENYLSLKEQLETLYNSLSKSNFKELKDKLILLRKSYYTADLSPEQKKEANIIFDECFTGIDKFYAKEKAEFELESSKNLEILSPMVEKAFFNAKYAENDDINEAWNYCIEVQQEFKGKKIQREIRDTLYSQLQEAFDILNEKRENIALHKEKKSSIIKEDLLPKITKVVETAEKTNDISSLWEALINYQQKIREENLSNEVRTQLFDKLQEGFTILKIRREEEKEKFSQAAKNNAEVIENLIQKGEELVQNSENFKETFEELKIIQQAFKEHKLLKEDREVLYQRLQDAFETIKAKQNKYFEEKDREADENYNRLKPLVEKAFERAQTSMEFKKTKEHLKKIQAEFKGIKMRANEREELYSKLQSCFDTLHKRQDEYYASKKDKIELHINYQISDIDLKIQALKDDINKDLASINSLSESEDNLIIDDTSTDPSQDIDNHIKIRKAAIARKEEELAELTEKKENLLIKKNKWEDID